MQLKSSWKRAVVAGLLFTLLVIAIAFWWLCARSEGIPFLPTKSGGEWIVYPNPPNAGPHPAGPLSAIFRRSFSLPAAPSRARLSIRAFKQGTVEFNGHSINELQLSQQGWKTPQTAEVAKLIRIG